MTRQPKRVQRKRTRGWRAPLCGCGCGQPARYVGRGSRWGNPWRYKHIDGRGYALYTPVWEMLISYHDDDRDVQKEVVRRYADGIKENWFPEDYARAARELGGHDLMCWCPLDQPCHADVLIEIANKEDDSE